MIILALSALTLYRVFWRVLFSIKELDGCILRFGPIGYSPYTYEFTSIFESNRAASLVFIELKKKTYLSIKATKF